MVDRREPVPRRGSPPRLDLRAHGHQPNTGPLFDRRRIPRRAGPRWAIPRPPALAERALRLREDHGRARTPLHLHRFRRKGRRQNSHPPADRRADRSPQPSQPRSQDLHDPLRRPQRLARSLPAAIRVQKIQRQPLRGHAPRRSHGRHARHRHRSSPQRDHARANLAAAGQSRRRARVGLGQKSPQAPRGYSARPADAPVCVRHQRPHRATLDPPPPAPAPPEQRLLQRHRRTHHHRALDRLGPGRRPVPLGTNLHGLRGRIGHHHRHCLRRALPRLGGPARQGLPARTPDDQPHRRQGLQTAPHGQSPPQRLPRVHPQAPQSHPHRQRAPAHRLRRTTLRHVRKAPARHRSLRLHWHAHRHRPRRRAHPRQRRQRSHALDHLAHVQQQVSPARSRRDQNAPAHRASPRAVQRIQRLLPRSPPRQAEHDRTPELDRRESLRPVQCETSRLPTRQQRAHLPHRPLRGECHPQ